MSDTPFDLYGLTGRGEGSVEVGEAFGEDGVAMRMGSAAEQAANGWWVDGGQGEGVGEFGAGGLPVGGGEVLAEQDVGQWVVVRDRRACRWEAVRVVLAR